MLPRGGGRTAAKWSGPNGDAFVLHLLHPRQRDHTMSERPPDLVVYHARAPPGRLQPALLWRGREITVVRGLCGGIQALAMIPLLPC